MCVMVVNLWIIVVLVFGLLVMMDGWFEKVLVVV